MATSSAAAPLSSRRGVSTSARGQARVFARAATATAASAPASRLSSIRRRRPPRVVVAVASSSTPSSSSSPPLLPLSVGFDLGTANSSVAVFRRDVGGPVIVPDEDSGAPSVTTPSWVAVDPKTLKLLVGHRAKRQSPNNPANSFGSAKRLLGRKYRSLPRGELSALGYGVVEAFDGRAAVWCPARGEALTPEEVCGALLAHLADRARRSGGGVGGSSSSSSSSSSSGESGGESGEGGVTTFSSSSPPSSSSSFISNAVVTVPARFGEEQLGAVRAAAEAAGLKGVRLVHEPVAAAIAYGLGSPRARADGTPSSPPMPLAETTMATATVEGTKQQQPQPVPFDDDTVLVVDLGGGTLDVAVVDAFEGMLEVIGSSGDARLGGDDWDSALAEWLEGQHPVAAALAAVGGRAGSAAARVHLLQAAEEAKRALTDSQETSVEIRLVQGGVWIGAGGAGAGSEGLAAVSGLSAASAAAAASSVAAAARSEFARVAASAPPVAKVALSRQRFEAMTRHLTERLWAPLREAAEEAGVELADDGLSSAEERRQRSSTGASSSSSSSSAPTPDSVYAPSPRRITRAILVGGGTRVPAVAALVERATGVKPESGIDPEAAVALGAAALAGQLAGLGGSVELGDGAYAPDVHGRASGFD